MAGIGQFLGIHLLKIILKNIYFEKISEVRSHNEKWGWDKESRGVLGSIYWPIDHYNLYWPSLF